MPELDEPLREVRADEARHAGDQALHGVPSGAARSALTSIDHRRDRIDEPFPALDVHGHSHRGELVLRKGKALQLHQILLCGHYQVEPATPAGDLLPVFESVIVMVRELQKVVETRIPLLERAVEGLRIRQAGHAERPVCRQSAHGKLAPNLSVRRHQRGRAQLAVVHRQSSERAFDAGAEPLAVISLDNERGLGSPQRSNRLTQPPGGQHVAVATTMRAQADQIELATQGPMLEAIVEHQHVGAELPTSKRACFRSVASDDHRPAKAPRQHRALVADHRGVLRSGDVRAAGHSDDGRSARTATVAAQHDRHEVATRA